MDEENMKELFAQYHWEELKDPDGLYIYYKLAGHNWGVVTLQEFLSTMGNYI